MKINLTEMMRQKGRLADINAEMESIFNGINAELESVSSNINSTGLHQSILTLQDNIKALSATLTNNVNQLESFMERQLSSYTITNEEVNDALQNLVTYVQETFDADGNIIIKATASVTAAGIASDASAIESYLSGVQGSSVALPEGLGRSHTYMGWQLITAKSSMQYKLKEAAGMNFDENGFGKIGDRYVVATTTTFGKVGDYIDVVQNDGTIIKGIIGDIKSQNDRGCNKWGHDNGQSVVEFVIDKDSWYHTSKTVDSFHPEWKQGITKIINKGNYFDLNS